MTFYSRNLPHWHPEGASLFITWRLYGSLPGGARKQEDTARSGCATKPSPGMRFKLLDSILDKCSTGPHWLKDPRIAHSLVATIYRGDSILNHYRLHAFVVMPNHVHLLVTPMVPVSQITNGIKGVSARDANRILGRTGKPYWQDESYDHWVRTSREFDRLRTYIEFNPVSAGLVARPEDWPWSSACGTATPGCAPSTEKARSTLRLTRAAGRDVNV